MKKVLTSDQGTPGLLPFLSEALERGIVAVGESYEVLTVSESRKRSGYILKSRAFQAFIWKSDPICEVMLETLNELLHINPSCALYIEVTEETVEGMQLYVDDEVVRMWTKSKKSNVLDHYQSTAMSATRVQSKTKPGTK
jgi:hypothetical protein